MSNTLLISAMIIAILIFLLGFDGFIKIMVLSLISFVGLPVIGFGVIILGIMLVLTLRR